MYIYVCVHFFFYKNPREYFCAVVRNISRLRRSTQSRTQSPPYSRPSFFWAISYNIDIAYIQTMLLKIHWSQGKHDDNETYVYLSQCSIVFPISPLAAKIERVFDIYIYITPFMYFSLTLMSLMHVSRVAPL